MIIARRMRGICEMEIDVLQSGGFRGNSSAYNSYDGGYWRPLLCYLWIYVVVIILIVVRIDTSGN